MQVTSSAKGTETIKKPSSELSKQKRSGSIKRDSIVTIQEEKETEASTTGTPAPAPILEDEVPAEVQEGAEDQEGILREASLKSAVLMQPSEQHRESVR